jgi:NAD(P) transhydrogenase subunit alpha
MHLIIGVPKRPSRRAAGCLVPELEVRETRPGVIVQLGAGTAAGFLDPSYALQGARLVPDVFDEADILLTVQPPTVDEIGKLKQGSTLIGFLQPHTNASGIQALVARNVTAFAMELMPRIARAQPMDALSAMSTISGYKAVLIAASRLPSSSPSS